MWKKDLKKWIFCNYVKNVTCDILLLHAAQTIKKSSESHYNESSTAKKTRVEHSIKYLVSLLETQNSNGHDFI